MGNGGRESALARAMAADSTLYAVLAHPNPSIVAQVQASGGAYLVGDVCDGQAIADFAAASGVELAMVSSDEPLAAGVVDELREGGIDAVGPTAAGSEIEWNKVYARELLADVCAVGDPAPADRPRRGRSARGDRIVRWHAGRSQADGPDRRQGREGDGPAPRGPRRGARVRALAARRRRRRQRGARRGADRRRRVHDPGDQRRPDRRVPARDLRLPVPLRRRPRPGHRWDGLALARLAHAAVHDRAPLRRGGGDHRGGDRASRRRRAALQRRHEQRLLRHRPTA